MCSAAYTRVWGAASAHLGQLPASFPAEQRSLLCDNSLYGPPIREAFAQGDTQGCHPAQRVTGICSSVWLSGGSPLRGAFPRAPLLGAGVAVALSLVRPEDGPQVPASASPGAVSELSHPPGTHGVRQHTPQAR